MLPNIQVMLLVANGKGIFLLNITLKLYLAADIKQFV